MYQEKRQETFRVCIKKAKPVTGVGTGVGAGIFSLASRGILMYTIRLA